MFNILILAITFSLSSLSMNDNKSSLNQKFSTCGCDSSDGICLRALQSCLDEVEDYDTIAPSSWGGSWIKDAYVAGCGMGYIKCKNRRNE